MPKSIKADATMANFLLPDLGSELFDLAVSGSRETCSECRIPVINSFIARATLLIWSR